MLLNLNSHISIKSVLNLLMRSQYSLQYVKSAQTLDCATTNLVHFWSNNRNEKTCQSDLIQTYYERKIYENTFNNVKHFI
jgi:hypothetical protein